MDYHRVIIFVVFATVSGFAQEPPKTNRELTISKIEGLAKQRPSLPLRWYTINDSTCQINLANFGIRPVTSSSLYYYSAEGQLKTSAAVVAYEIVFALFDVWGERISNLSLQRVRDVKSGVTERSDGTWHASESNAVTFLTSVAYVNKVMTSDGKIWSANLKVISDKLSEVQITISESGLDPKTQKDPRDGAETSRTPQ